jgi:superfamily II DNA or RNA helicase
MEKKGYLGQYGYTLFKKNVSTETLNQLRTKLMVTPVTSGYNGGSTKSFPIFRENDTKIFLPRFWAEQNVGPIERNTLPAPHPIDLEFKGTLQDRQMDAVNSYLSNRNSNGCGGLLQMPCGFGKTIIALKLISVLKVKTAFFVHTQFLATQIKDRIMQFLPSARVGFVQGKIVQLEDQDIVICMVQTVYNNAALGERMRNAGFGLTCFDEAHHISSEQFSKCLFQLVTPYVFGLSATFNRADNTLWVIKAFLGDIVFTGQRDQHKVKVQRILYEPLPHDPTFAQEERDAKGQFAFTSMVTKLVQYEPRNRFIAQSILYPLSQQSGQVIILSDRVTHLRTLATLVQKVAGESTVSMGFYIGGMKEAALKDSSTKKLLFATYKMAAEGLDLPTLTKLIMVTPRKEIEQSVGRILRVRFRTAFVYDIVDIHSSFLRQSKKRLQFYHQCQFNVRTVSSTQNLPVMNAEAQDDADPEEDDDEEDEEEPTDECMI